MPGVRPWCVWGRGTGGGGVVAWSHKQALSRRQMRGSSDMVAQGLPGPPTNSGDEILAWEAQFWMRVDPRHVYCAIFGITACE